jgi:hypothetical protein
VKRCLNAVGAFTGLVLGGIALAVAVPIVPLLFVLDPAFRFKINDPGIAVWRSIAALAACVTGGVLLVQMWLLMRRSGAGPSRASS